MSLRVEFARSLARWREEEILLVMFREVEITEDLMDELVDSIFSMTGSSFEKGMLSCISETASTLVIPFAGQNQKTKIINPKAKIPFLKNLCVIFSLVFTLVL